MEEENNEVKTKKESYITGIIGALIGGTIATIPWVLMYVYGNMMLSILAALIAAGEFYGYKIAKGKINKKLPAILMVLAIIIVTIATLVVIPALLIQKQNIPVTVDTIKLLYSDSEFVTAFMRDFIISIIFTILGASIITANIKKQLQENDGKDIKIDLNNNKQLEEAKNNAIEMIKPIFIKYDATEESKAMMKEEVFAEIEDKSAKQSFNYLKQLKVIKKYKGKYYYSEENEKKQLKPKKISTMGIVGIIILVCAIIAMFLSLVGNFGTDKQFKDENVSFEISDKWNEATADYDTEWNFYKYINSIPSAEKSQNTEGEEDYSSYPAIINVYYDDVNSEYVSSIDDIKTNIETNFNSTEMKPDTFDLNVIKTENGYDLLKAKIIYNNEPEEVLYYYYILKDDKLACITAYSFTLKDEAELEKQADKLINSFEWLK